jgi:hypothetical protein
MTAHYAARGGRDAKQHAADERRNMALYASGALTDYTDAHERAVSESETCPYCSKDVHPSNWNAHMALYHAEDALTDDTPKTTEVATGDQELPLSLILMNGGTQSRAAINEEVVNEYAESMKDGALFPSVIVFYDGEHYWLADGFHRVHAAKRTDATKIFAIVQQGTRRDAVLFSVGANATHGLKRTNADKRRSVTTLLSDEEWVEWSNSKIAKACGVSHTMVNEMRSILKPFQDTPSDNGGQITRKATRNGTTYTVKTENIGKSKPSPESEGVAQAVLGATYNKQHEELSAAFEGASETIKDFIVRHNIPVAEKVEILKRLEKSAQAPESNGTFDEIMATGGFHYGESMELWCDFIKDSIQAIQRALDSLSRIHAQVAGEANDTKNSEQYHGHRKTDSNEYYTPAEYVEAVRAVLGTIDLDPASCEEANRTVKAADYFTAEDNGLKRAWVGKVFLNPPYGRDIETGGGNQGVWSARLIEQYRVGLIEEAILLVSANTDCKWFDPLWDFPMVFTRRIDFDAPEGQQRTGPNHGSVLVYFGNNPDTFNREMRKFGRIVVPCGTFSEVLP